MTHRRRCLPGADAALSGMTLIELMVVIVVLGVVASMIVPGFGGSLSTVRLRTGARRVGDMMDYCYRASTLTGRVHALVFDSGNQRFEVYAERPAGNDAAADAASFSFAGDSETPELETVSIPGDLDRTLPGEIKIGRVWTYDEALSKTDEGKVRLLFFPDGTAEFADVTLTARDGSQCTVSLDGLSGMIEIGDVKPAGEEDEGQAS